MEEWEHHVRESVDVYYCGVKFVVSDWFFLDVAHVVNTIKTSRLQPCPACLEAIKAQGLMPAED